MFADLYVVTVVSNPERYKSRYALYANFEKYCLDSGAKLITVEAAFGNRPHAVTDRSNPNNIQLRTHSEIWHKENLINIGVSRLPPDWQYVAWIDADVVFARPDWVHETIHQLQHFHVVQMFSHATDLGPTYEPVPQFYEHPPASWVYCLQHRLLSGNGFMSAFTASAYGGEDDSYYWHPGFAWAARREALDALGGLIDWQIVGGGDYVMAACLTGVGDIPYWAQQGTNGAWTKEWKARADRSIKGNVGYVPGVLLHNWHGRKAHRNYKNRQQLLLDNDFDPQLDLKRDWQGLWQLTGRKPGLRDDIRNYMRSRNEDRIDTE